MDLVEESFDRARESGWIENAVSHFPKLIWVGPRPVRHEWLTLDCKQDVSIAYCLGKRLYDKDEQRQRASLFTSSGVFQLETLHDI